MPKYHVFICGQQRPPGHPRGCCTSAGGGQKLFDRLIGVISERNLWESGISAAQASCLGSCKTGPVMVVYPENVWYQPTKVEDIDEIVQSHFIDGKPVERLLVSSK